MSQSESLKPFEDFDAALTARQAAWVGEGEGDKLPVEFYAIELVGELGELFNVIKKLMREQYGVRGSRATQQDKEDEFGDVLICLKNMAAKYGVDLEKVARAKFNATSEKYGFPHRVTLANPSTADWGGEVEVRATTAGDGWQPIETAPKDGRSIWAYLYHTGIRLVRWGSAEEWAEKEGGNPDDFKGQWVEVYDESEDWSPKWWLPADALPLPPALVTDKG